MDFYHAVNLPREENNIYLSIVLMSMICAFVTVVFIPFFLAYCKNTKMKRHLKNMEDSLPVVPWHMEHEIRQEIYNQKRNAQGDAINLRKKDKETTKERAEPPPVDLLFDQITQEERTPNKRASMVNKKTLIKAAGRYRAGSKKRSTERPSKEQEEGKVDTILPKRDTKKEDERRDEVKEMPKETIREETRETREEANQRPTEEHAEKVEVDKTKDDLSKFNDEKRSVLQDTQLSQLNGAAPALPPPLRSKEKAETTQSSRRSPAAKSDKLKSPDTKIQSPLVMVPSPVAPIDNSLSDHTQRQSNEKVEFSTSTQRMEFPSAGGAQTFKVKNHTGKKAAMKVMCSNGKDYRIEPAAAFVEPNEEAVISVTRTAGAAPRPDKIVIHVGESVGASLVPNVQMKNKQKLQINLSVL